MSMLSRKLTFNLLFKFLITHRRRRQKKGILGYHLSLFLDQLVRQQLKHPDKLLSQFQDHLMGQILSLRIQVYLWTLKKKDVGSPLVVKLLVRVQLFDGSVRSCQSLYYIGS